MAEKTKTPRKEGDELSSLTELLGNAVFRFLRDRDYIKADHNLSKWGQALLAALNRARDSFDQVSAETEEAIYMAFELLRLQVLNNQLNFPVPQFSGQPLRGSESDKANTLLISRVACLGLFHHREIGYTGPLSRHLLAFHQMAAVVRSSLRGLLEMHACAIFTSGDASRQVSPKQITDLAASLPFTREPDLGLSLVVKSYLDELSQEPSKRGDVRKWFNYVEDIDDDLRRAWKLWGKQHEWNPLRASVTQLTLSLIDLQVL
ncbi:hypothetical protein BAUCODRAFT_404806 [Baudoinia panamericana UAMH 10762]|uniref:Post-transcriptional regulator MKT1 C-terminal domain-containing protein n=1 Tax=Baudoinia panamericana (strain UAMH 10762) TaxID=717646 RepID=M2N1K0_BAUPA|nr:uncharacterized protein BAUCODRAFT_404806 [Baudoinia panamericana UAMH 10762]EMC97808.1 hypothetical protein BAUCODRAFT_404806 [Baudoinia panamericana UAMH 10762]